MFEKLYPNDYISSIYEVDFKKLYAQGYRGIIFDVDNTLVPHNAPADDRAKGLFSLLKKIGFKTLLLSNNKEPRVKEFCAAVNADDYIYKAGKPNPIGYISATEKIGTTVDTSIFVGDQIFTDIWGANRAGIRTIMVMPVKKWKEEIQIIAKRFLEAVILLMYSNYKKKGGAQKRVPLLNHND